jgi:hypothetical protein
VSAQQLRRLVLAEPALYHVTRVDWLCDIAATGALLPPDEFGMSKARDTWGENHTYGRKLVCLSLMPSWSIVKRLDGRELAILQLDTAEVVYGRDVRVSPINSWSSAATKYLSGEAALGTALDESLYKDKYTTARVEVLVAGAVPTSTIRRVVLSDLEAVARWRRTLDEAFAQHGVRVPIRASDPDRWPYFAPDHFVAVREDVRPGVDRRALVAPLAVPPALAPPELTDEEWDWLLEEDRRAEPRDLFEERFIDRAAAFAELADEDDDLWD